MWFQAITEQPKIELQPEVEEPGDSFHCINEPSCTLTIGLGAAVKQSALGPLYDVTKRPKTVDGSYYIF